MQPTKWLKNSLYMPCLSHCKLYWFIVLWLDIHEHIKTLYMDACIDVYLHNCKIMFTLGAVPHIKLEFSAPKWRVQCLTVECFLFFVVVFFHLHFTVYNLIFCSWALFGAILFWNWNTGSRVTVSHHIWAYNWTHLLASTNQHFPKGWVIHSAIDMLLDFRMTVC